MIYVVHTAWPLRGNGCFIWTQLKKQELILTPGETLHQTWGERSFLAGGGGITLFFVQTKTALAVRENPSHSYAGTQGV